MSFASYDFRTSLLEAINASLRFGLELCALLAFGYWGFATASTALAGLVGGIGAPLAFALGWGAWVAPKAPFRLDDPARFGLEVAVFSAAATALADAGTPLLGGVLAVSVAVNLVLMFALGQRRLGGI